MAERNADGSINRDFIHPGVRGDYGRGARQVDERRRRARERTEAAQRRHENSHLGMPPPFSRNSYGPRPTARPASVTRALAEIGLLQAGLGRPRPVAHARLHPASVIAEVDLDLLELAVHRPTP